MKLGELNQTVRQFLTHDIWRIPSGQYSRTVEFIVRQLRIILITLKGLNEDEVQIRATALTYYSVFALVPLLAVFLSVAKLFNYDAYLVQQITTTFQGQEEVMKWFLNFADTFITNTTTGVLAGFGIIALIWSVMNIFGSIEQSLNGIWEVNKTRHFARRLRDYVAILFLAPLLLITLGSSTVFITSKLSSLSDSFALFDYLSPFVTFLLKLIPYVLVWILFTTLYTV
ncbi:MAG: YihY/virulence factor BrkB family protein, partial [Bacteroidales bacterium]|nr:YihY/virulence factor BrkB family protein [Bacteroidales bacterium]